MAKGYLERKLMESLVKHGLVENNRVPIIYIPEESGYKYKRAVHWVSKNSSTIGLTAAGFAGLGAAAAGYYDKESLARYLAGGIGAFSGLGLLFRFLAPIHRKLRRDPEVVAESYFAGLDVLWHEAYDSVQINSKAELDGHVYLAQTANKIVENRVHKDTHIALGIGIARTADILASLRFDSKLPGFDLADVIDMLIKQKVGSEDESELFDQMHELYGSKNLARFVRKYIGGDKGIFNCVE
jgi:hypothetical protein